MNLNKHIVYDGLHPVAFEIKRARAMGLDIMLDAENDVMKRYRFNNGYGASLIKGFASFGMWELAVLKFSKLPKNRLPKSKRLRKKYFKLYQEQELKYNTPVTGDVKRYRFEDMEELNNDLNLIKHFNANQF